MEEALLLADDGVGDGVGLTYHFAISLSARNLDIGVMSRAANENRLNEKVVNPGEASSHTRKMINPSKIGEELKFPDLIVRW